MKPSSSVRRVTLLLLASAALLVLMVIAANYRGRSTWQKCRRELEAKGECLDWRAFVPPPVPDDQNFATTPLLAPLFDFVTTSEGHLRPRDTNAVERLKDLFAGSGNLGGSW